jgi:hypothetical protein
MRGLHRSRDGLDAFPLASKPHLHDIFPLGRTGCDPGAASFHDAPKPMRLANQAAATAMFDRSLQSIPRLWPAVVGAILLTLAINLMA